MRQLQLSRKAKAGTPESAFGDEQTLFPLSILFVLNSNPEDSFAAKWNY